MAGTGIFDLDPGPDTVEFASAGPNSFPLVKLDATGAFLWAHTDVGPGKAILLSDGNLLESYAFQGTVDADPGPGVLSFTSMGNDDVIVRKIDPNGELIWAERFGAAGHEFVGAMAEMADGSLVLAGSFSGTTTLDPAGIQGVHANNSTGGALDMYVLKLDANGTYMWSNSSGGLQSEDYTELTLTPNGNMLLTGYVSVAPADVDPGPGVYTVDPGGGHLYFLLELDSDGEFVRVYPLISDGWADISAVLYHTDGELYVAGEFGLNVGFGLGTTLLEAPVGAGFIAKYDADGQFMWANEYGGDDLIFRELAMSVDGNLIAAGTFEAPFDADPGPNIAMLNSYGQSDIFLMDWDPDDNYHWSTAMGSTGADDVRSLLLLPNGAISLAGQFRSTMDFDIGPGSDSYTATGYGDGFVAFYNESPCAGLHYEVNAFEPVLCTQLGSIAGTIVGGVEPYTYSWDLDPAQVGLSVTMDAPGPATITVTDATGCTQMLTLIMNGVEYQSFDLLPALVGTTFRAGQVSHLWVDVANAGCVTPDAQLQLVMPELVSLSMAEPPPTSVSGDTLMWAVGEVAAAYPAMQVLVDVAVSDTATAGSSVCFKATLSPTEGDADTTNNMRVLCGFVQNSYDPNEMRVVPPGACDEGYVSLTQPLMYTVRFQNTGNAAALDVVVVDSLPHQLDAGSMRIIGYSHPMYTEMTPGNVARFIFNDINLADSTANEPQSHGYVVFELDPIQDVESLDQTTNEAEIYFDYNNPVATNIVSNTFIDVVPVECNAVGILDQLVSPDAIVIRPNPCTSRCYVHCTGGEPIDRLEVVDCMGRVLQVSNPHSSEDVKLEGMKPGLYVVRIWIGGKASIARLVVE
jgi:uncharacterized repeat protein (TIGR01451 family)